MNRGVLSFEDGRQAWNFIQQNGNVDIVICDVDMPEMDGIEFITRMKETNSKAIFIMMSGIVENEPKCLLAGADGFLAKPFEINDLFDLVQQFVVEEPA